LQGQPSIVIAGTARGETGSGLSAWGSFSESSYAYAVSRDAIHG
jgi:hypothetical protein